MHWNKILRVLPFVQTERPAPSRRNENFTFNQNYPAKSVKYWIVCTKKMVFPQKLLKRPFHFQTDWSGNGPAGQLWQMDWAPLTYTLYCWIEHTIIRCYKPDKILCHAKTHQRMGAKRKSILQKLKTRKMCSLKGNQYFFPKRKRKQVRLNEQWCTPFLTFHI